jgi:hypothetical protein
MLRPVTPDGQNRHQRRAASHGDDDAPAANGDLAGPFGDHTPEFFARELRRSMQAERRLAKQA